MNKQIRTLLTLLLLSVFGATTMWAQSNLSEIYVSNLEFITGFNNNAGTLTTVKEGSSTADPYAISARLTTGSHASSTISFMLPIGTKYLHFHGLGKTTGVEVNVAVNGTTITPTSVSLPYDSERFTIDANGIVTFKKKPTADFYKVITFNEPLTAPARVTFSATDGTKSFVLFGVNFETADGKGSSSNPFTASEALSMMNSKVLISSYQYFTGKVSTTKTISDEGKASFSISDDPTTNNNVRVSSCSYLNGAAFSPTDATQNFQLNPLDQVVIQAKLYVRSNPVSLTSGKLNTITPPTYKVQGTATNGAWMEMQRSTDVPYEHTLEIGQMTPNDDFFHIEESYGDTFSRSYWGPGNNDEKTAISWETKDNFTLTPGNGSHLTVDTEGNNYTLKVNQVVGGPTLSVEGFATPKFYLNRNGAEPVELVADSGMFRAFDVAMEKDQEFWISKGLGAESSVYAAPSDSPSQYINRNNSNPTAAVLGGINYKMSTTGNFNFKFIMNTSTGDATLTVTGWPDLIYRVYGSSIDNSRFTKNDDGSYTNTLEVTSEMFVNNKVDFSIACENLEENWAYYGIPSSIGQLNSENSQNVPLGTGDDYLNISVNRVGTYTLTINPDFTLTIEWPDLIYSLTQLDNSEFTKNDDGSYTKTLEVTTEMFVNNKFDFSIICKNLEEAWVYYGIPSTYGYLNRENSQNIPLGTGEGYLNISLGHAGTYTLTINPDFTLTIEWPTPEYQLCHRKSNNAQIYQIPFVYDERAKSWTLAEPVLFESGEQLWVTDTQTGQGWGLNEENPTINMGNSSNLYLYPNGPIPSIAGLCPFPLNIMFTEDPTSSCLIANITGWPEPGYYLYYFTGWNVAGLANKFQDNGDGTFTLTRKDIKNEYTDDSYRFVIMHINSDGTQTIYSHSDEETTLIPQTDGNRSYPLTQYVGTDKMFELSPGVYTFEINNGVDRPYLTVKAEEKMYSVIANGDVENSDMSCFFKQEGGGHIVQATYTAGAGKNGTRGIVVQSRDRSSSEFNWDTEFFIRANQTLPAGTKYHLAFDYKASRDGAGSEAHSQAEPGEYIWYHFPVTPNFMSEWQHFELEGEISQEESPTDNMRTIDILLGLYPEATTYYFDNIVFEIDRLNLEEPMVDIVKNGDVEGEDMSCFFKSEGRMVDGEFTFPIEPATYTEGAGMNDSRSIIVTTSEDAPAECGALFYIRLPQTLSEGTKYRISFDIMSDNEALTYTNAHGEPGEYVYYNALDFLHSYPYWTHFERKGIISAEQAQNNGILMRTFAFLLDQNHENEVNHFYFDNIKFEIDEAHVAKEVIMGDVNGDGTVSIQDVVLLVDYTLNKPVSGFVIEAADVTGDGQINVSDVVGIVNIVLKKN